MNIVSLLRIFRVYTHQHNDGINFLTIFMAS